MLRKALVLPLLALVACADADGDGLSDAREGHLGSDPGVADTDGDGMNDGDEVAAKCDPAAWDTDGDGYSDFQEVDYGSDPLDAASGVYAGGWPYNPFKDDMVDPGFDVRPSQGEPVARFIALDQFGEQVDLYDYAGHGNDVMIDLSAMWCGPCKQISGWLAGNDPAGYGEFEIVREAVTNGDLYWITVLGEDVQGAYPDATDLQKWDEWYGAENVAVLADTRENDVVGYYDIAFWPSLYLLDENLQLVRGPSTQSFVPPLTTAKQRLQAAAE